MSLAPLILIVEDETDVWTLFANVVNHNGHRVAATNERSTGAEIMLALHPALLIADVRLRGGNGDDLATLADAMNIPVLLISGEPTAIQAHQGGTAPFLQKPFRLADLEAMIARLIGK